VWQSEDGDYTAVTSWSLGAIPTSGDIAYFDGTSHITPIINVADGAAGADEYVFTEAYRGGLASAGAGLHKTGVQKITIRGDGDYHFAIDSGDFPDVIIDNSRVQCSFDTIVRDVMIKQGYAHFLSTCAMTGEVILYGLAARALIEAVVHAGAFLENRRATTTSTENILQTLGGEILQTGLIETNTNIRVDMGTIRYAPSISPAAKAPDVFIGKGLFDARESKFPIVVSKFFVGPEGDAKGSIHEGVGTWGDFDLREDYP
jgi:hypothetical protein